MKSSKFGVVADVHYLFIAFYISKALKKKKRRETSNLVKY